MHTTNIITMLLLSLLSLTLASNLDSANGALLTSRQNGAAPNCLEYSLTANLSTVGANSTYRGAYLAISNVGTLANKRMLNAAQARLPQLTADAALNQACGNLTTVALTEAERNFTQGQILGVGGLANLPKGIVNGPIVCVLCGLIVLFCSVIWGLMP
ncbi:hypothetical protein BCR34DRAFT_345751 [Clohesyomyces aquaticus]|uniref:Uncharacterized protein n=1 Tax=Clohesyomyces aquaticus TaxID=1231657 RepID=A0A1Y1ZKA7_9PLEO|nr:hypothetical protein BCR34DRAFT_345751 [Clohesyomyces aquaticus]